MTDADWAQHTATINSHWAQAAQHPITWVRKISTRQKYGEDGNTKTEEVPLLGLVQANAFRTWPSTLPSQTGELDKENAALIFSREYLEGLGYMNANGYFNFDPGHDRFIDEGKVYKAFGDIAMAQSSTQGILVMIIVKREEQLTGD